LIEQRINLAFVGTGPWARRQHFPALSHLVETLPYEAGITLNLRGIASLELEDARAVAAEVGFEVVYPHVNALLDDPDIDAIAVAVPPAAAKPVLEQVIARQVPLFSEKPPGISLAEAEALAALVQVPNLLAFNRRFAPLNNTFKEIVADMEGVYFVEGHFLRHRRLDPAFMIGTGIHWINFMIYCFGEIQASTVERFPNPQEECWNRVAQLTFPGDVRGLLKVFPCSGTTAEQLEVHSSGQSVYLDGPLGSNPGRIIVTRGEAQEVIEQEVARPEFVRIGILGEYREFFTRTCAGLPTRSTFQNAVNTMRVAEALE
jgi:predicted dehydrogenase